MTSWISSSLPKKKVAPLPVSLFPPNQGTFESKTQQATIVTAWYDLPSSIPFVKQQEKMEAFFGNMDFPMCIFTEPQLADRIASYRSGYESLTRVIVVDPNDWVSRTKFLPSLWSQQVKQDPEVRMGRTAEEFQFGYEKKEFVMKSIKLNPFSSTDFVWMDPQSIYRADAVPGDLLFPRPSQIPVDRMLVVNPEPFTADDLASSYFRGKRRLDNSMIAGPATQWKEFDKLYDIVMTQKLKISAFVGDDLLMNHYMIIHKPNQFTLVNDVKQLQTLG